MFTSNDHTFAVCAYGVSPHLAECVESVLSQQVKSHVIIVTSTPNDSIEKVASQFKLPLYVSGGEPGIARDWNHAVARCSTPLITIAHQDDIYEPGYSEAMLNAVNSVKRPLIFFSNYGELRAGERVISNRLLNVKRILLAPLRIKLFSSLKWVRRRCLSLGCSICCPSVTLCMQNIDSPVFAEGYKSDLDWQAWERISRKNGSFLYDGRVLMFHRIHEGSETSALIENQTRTQEDLEMLKAFWPDPIAGFINRFYSKSQQSNSL